MDKKILTKLEIAMSRIKQHGEKCYVQHKLRENGDEIVDLVLRRGAYFYVCGDGNNMARDVYNTIKDLLIQQGGISASEAEETLTDMKQRRRYVLDIWS